VAISDGALIPGQPSGPAPGLAKRTRSAVAVVAALPRRGERNRGRGDAGARCAADTTHSQAWPADESRLCAKGTTGLPVCPTASKAPARQAGALSARSLPGTGPAKSARTSNYGCSSARPVSSRCPCRTAVTHAPGRCAAATICGVLRPLPGTKTALRAAHFDSGRTACSRLPGASPAGL
jgi:hypothetical protein